jgi:hypothetical protein
MKGLFVLVSLALAQENDDPVFTTADGATSATCPNITVLEDVSSGWYDACLGLKKQMTTDDPPVPISTAEACKATCVDDMHCSVWQLVKHNEDPVCWSGSVFHGCLSRGSGDPNSKAVTTFEGDLVAGESLQHGFIKVVGPKTDAQVMGLKHFVEKTGEAADRMERCKKICYTDTTCTVWQYGSDGCWVEHKPTNPAGDSKNDTKWLEGLLGGETVEHTCPPYVPEEGLPWPWIITGIVLGLLALAAIIYALTKKPKVKKTRAVKIQPKPDPPLVPLFIPQPTVLIPQQSVVMAPPVMQQQVVYETAAPMTTYAAPTTTYAAPTVAQTQPLLSAPMVSGGAVPMVSGGGVPMISR